MKKFKQYVLTVNGQPASIIGIKQCRVQIGEWDQLVDVIVADNTIKQCIIGMDVLNRCPSTKTQIKELKRNAYISTKHIQYSRIKCEPINRNNFQFPSRKIYEDVHQETVVDVRKNSNGKERSCQQTENENFRKKSDEQSKSPLGSVNVCTTLNNSFSDYTKEPYNSKTCEYSKEASHSSEETMNQLSTPMMFASTEFSTANSRKQKNASTMNQSAFNAFQENASEISSEGTSRIESKNTAYSDSSSLDESKNQKSSKGTSQHEFKNPTHDVVGKATGGSRKNQDQESKNINLFNVKALILTMLKVKGGA